MWIFMPSFQVILQNLKAWIKWSIREVLWKILWNSQEAPPMGSYFLVKIQAWLCNFTIKGVHCSFSLWTFTKFLKNCYLIGHLWTGASGHKKIFKRFFPTNIDLLKVNDRNSWKRCEICSKFSIKTLERCQWRRSGGFNC